jgi:hypothetical protein
VNELFFSLVTTNFTGVTVQQQKLGEKQKRTELCACRHVEGLDVDHPNGFFLFLTLDQRNNNKKEEEIQT